MRLLSKVIHKGDHVVDAGSGSGILTIASLILGAQHVVSVDIDPHCLDVIQRNMNINELDCKNAEIIIGDILKINIDYNNFNVILLNIGPTIAAELLKTHGTFIQNSTRIIISGLTRWSKNKVDDAIQLCQRDILETYSEDGEWITYLI
jgi:ribosomal protein L11 methyltransferase